MKIVNKPVINTATEGFCPCSDDHKIHSYYMGLNDKGYPQCQYCGFMDKTRRDYRENPMWNKDGKSRIWMNEITDLTPEQLKLLELPPEDRRRYFEGEWHENSQ